jgi:hypothetical protein
MSFRASFCEPLNPEIIELGEIHSDSIIDKFETINWSGYLRAMQFADQKEIQYSPSLEIENKDNQHGLAISAVGDPDNFEFYIFYKRPKKVKRFFGLIEKVDNNYISDKTAQTRKDVLDCLTALIRNDTHYLANKIGQ